MPLLFQIIFSRKRVSAVSYPKRACAVFTVLAVWVLLSAPVLAQTPSTTQTAAPLILPGLIILKDGEERLKIGPRTYVTRDTGGGINYSTLIENHLSGRRGTTGNNSVLSLGVKASPSWLVFSLRNDSRANRNWVLSLGGHADGRYGTVKEAFLYDHLSQRYALYAMPDKKGVYPAEKSLPLYGTGIPFDLAPGQQALMVLYVVPEGGIPVTLAPEILTQHAFWQTRSGFFSKTSIVPVTLLAAFGLFSGLLVFSRQMIAIPVILYFGAQIALYAVQDQKIYSSFPLASENTPLLLVLVSLSALLLGKFFLGIKENKNRSNLTIYSLMIVSFFSAAISVLVIPNTMVFRSLILTAIPLICLGILSAISIIMHFHRKPAAGFFAASWFILFLGTCLSVLSLGGILPMTSMLAGSYWIALLIQVPVLSGAVFFREWLIDQNEEESESTAEENAESMSRIRQAKDGAENSRLLRVIEHERQMLQDLRDREIEQNEAMRKAKENADMANRAKSAFLAVISHEIRTPMSGVMGMVRLLLDTQLNKDQRDYARTIQDSGDAMLALLNDILDFEKIESGNLDLEIIDFDLPRLINDIITLMSGHATQKGIFLKSDLGPDIPRYVRGDPVRLRQVLLNLTGNALKFTSEGGVTLSLKRTDWEGISQKGMSRLTFAIRDTGIGISKDAQKNLFNPFSQADSSITRKYGGTGLGLTICQRLIEAMGGEILIDSIDGEGSTFYYTIALEDGHADQIEDAGMAIASRQSNRPEKVLTILCVDDNGVNQKLLKEFVSRLGHQPVLAGTGEEAIEKVKAQDIDMILMDIELPGISGMGATRAIRGLPEDKKASIPVIALTGHVRDEDIRQCYAANMNGHLAKPIEPGKLKAQVDKVLKSALDNPVELGERTPVKSAAHETRIVDPIMPPETVIRQEPESPSVSDAGVLHIPDNGDDELDDSFSIDDEIPDGHANVSPIRAYALMESRLKSTESTRHDFDLKDEDLDEDSFARAIEMSNTATGSVVFNHAMLDDLKKSMKSGDLQEMIGSLTSKTDEIVGTLQQAITVLDIEALTARGHELKGMCGNFGLQQLSDIGGFIEKAAKDHALDGLAEIIDTLPEMSSRAKQEIQSWISS